MTDRPWMTALEMQFLALRSAVRVLQSSDERLQWAPGQRLWKSTTLALEAAPYSWTNQTVNAVQLASTTLPEGARLDIELLPEAAWWWFDIPIEAPRHGDHSPELSDEEASTRGVLLARRMASDGSQALEVTAFGAMVLDNGTITPNPLTRWAWRDGTTVADVCEVLRSGRLNNEETTPDALTHTIQQIEAVCRFVLAAVVWLRQTVLVESAHPIERHRRKQLQREHGVVVNDVKVITLRRAESQQRESVNGESVEWSCRWIVNGHWRNQFHPSNGKHELKYILPYVKGPADKPLKVPTHTVYAVNR